jgi:hypothetical protein
MPIDELLTSMMHISSTAGTQEVFFVKTISSEKTKKYNLTSSRRPTSLSQQLFLSWSTSNFKSLNQKTITNKSPASIKQEEHDELLLKQLAAGCKRWTSYDYCRLWSCDSTKSCRWSPWDYVVSAHALRSSRNWARTSLKSSTLLASTT